MVERSSPLHTGLSADTVQPTVLFRTQPCSAQITTGRLPLPSEQALPFVSASPFRLVLVPRGCRQAVYPSTCLHA